MIERERGERREKAYIFNLICNIRTALLKKTTSLVYFASATRPQQKGAKRGVSTGSSSGAAQRFQGKRAKLTGGRG